MVNKAPILVFLHLPKTGGSSLRGVISSYYTDYIQLDGEDTNRPILDVLKQKNISPNLVTAIGGHIPFGLAEGLPGKLEYVTFLRNPRERIISDFYFIRRSPQHPLYNEIESGRMSFENFIECMYADNVMSKRLYPMAVGDKKQFYPDVGEKELLEGAVETLKRCQVVGLTEHFPESVELIASAFHWNNTPEIHFQNVTKERPKFDEIGTIEQELILAQTDCDQKLYDIGKEIFKKQRQSLVSVVS